MLLSVLVSTLIWIPTASHDPTFVGNPCKNLHWLQQVCSQSACHQINLASYTCTSFSTLFLTSVGVFRTATVMFLDPVSYVSESMVVQFSLPGAWLFLQLPHSCLPFFCFYGGFYHFFFMYNPNVC